VIKEANLKLSVDLLNIDLHSDQRDVYISELHLAGWNVPLGIT